MHPRRSGLRYRSLVAGAAALAIVVLEPGRARGDHAELNAVSTDADPAIHGQNTADGPGVAGGGTTGPGVEGRSQRVGVHGTSGGAFDTIGVLGEAVDHEDADGLQNGFGVVGTGAVGVSGTGVGVGVDASPNAGVQGVGNLGVVGLGVGIDPRGDPITGVLGFGEIGVAGRSSLPNGVGVEGTTGGAGGIAVRAKSGDGIALQVEGTARFSTAGSGQIFPKVDLVTVSNARVTASSHVTLTLTDNPGNKIAVSWVERQPGVGFTAHLTDKTGGGVHHFTYLIVEP